MDVTRVPVGSDLPIFNHDTNETAEFRPENLLERASSRMEKQDGCLPPCCLLDFVSELVLSTTEADFDKGPSDVNNKIMECCFRAFAEAMHSG